MNENKQQSKSRQDQTHFGFQDVPIEEKAKKVGQVFHSVAAQYDVMNDLMSFGIHRIWKRITRELSGLRPGHEVLDLAGGTGDLSMLFSDVVGSSGRVVLSDINESMLSVGRDRLIDKGYLQNVQFALLNGEQLPFPDNSFDLISIGFGLRNFTDKDKALRAIYRCLKPGGRLLVLEFSKPVNPILQKLYDTYSFSVIPKIGKLVADDAESYQYLAESIRKHPDQETLKAMMRDAQFEDCDYFNMTGGIVAVHRGFKY
jgi:demethylmenaquinone methyltransferase/2-methoxy-6-polyprenyl-1,4-benzoquinol methylase